MKPGHSSACIGANEGKMNSRARRRAASRMAFVVFAFAALSGCEQNSFVPPPPPKVDVAVPVQRAVTRYLEATGNTAPINTVDLVARVQGVLQSINYQDGDFVKAGTTLFTISRILSKWAEQGFVVPRRESVLVNDLKRLESVGDEEV